MNNQSLPDNNVLFYARFQVTRHFSKKNGRDTKKNRTTGQLYPGKSKALTEAERWMGLQFIKAKMKFETLKNIDFPLSKQLHIKMVFYFPNYFTKKGELNQKMNDLSNLYELPQDVLTKTNVIVDDYLIQSHDGSRRKPGDKFEIEITITEFE